jgi:hypothetical protein
MFISLPFHCRVVLAKRIEFCFLRPSYRPPIPRSPSDVIKHPGQYHIATQCPSVLIDSSYILVARQHFYLFLFLFLSPSFLAFCIEFD